MMTILAAVLGFVVIASIGWVLVGGDDSALGGVKRAKALSGSRRGQATTGKLSLIHI